MISGLTISLTISAFSAVSVAYLFNQRIARASPRVCIAQTSSHLRVQTFPHISGKGLLSYIILTASLSFPLAMALIYSGICICSGHTSLHRPQLIHRLASARASSSLYPSTTSAKDFILSFPSSSGIGILAKSFRLDSFVLKKDSLSFPFGLSTPGVNKKESGSSLTYRYSLVRLRLPVGHTSTHNPHQQHLPLSTRGLKPESPFEPSCPSTGIMSMAAF